MQQLSCQCQNLFTYATGPGRVANGLCRGPDSVPAAVDPKRSATPTVTVPCHVGIRAPDRTRQHPRGHAPNLPYLALAPTFRTVLVIFMNKVPHRIARAVGEAVRSFR
jgi:hypothetical protein